MNDFKDYGSGALFTNTKKQKDSQPDYSGPLDITNDDGSKTTYRIVAWTKTDKNGRTFLSIKVNEFVADRDAPTGSSSAPPAGDLDDSIPF